jgi:hypothetical protein
MIRPDSPTVAGAVPEWLKASLASRFTPPALWLRDTLAPARIAEFVWWRYAPAERSRPRASHVGVEFLVLSAKLHRAPEVAR